MQLTHGFHWGGSSWQNWLLQGEKWFLDNSGHWFFVTPSGGVFQWNGGTFAGSTQIGTVAQQVYSDLTLLLNPLPSVLTIVQSAGPLTQTQVKSLLVAAEQRWQTTTTLTAAQQAALDNLTFSVTTLSGGLIGSFTPGHVVLDATAGGFGWYVDATPNDDAEFSAGAAPTDRFAAPLRPPAGHVDLLTVMVHEMGHALGLADQNANPNDVMYTYLGIGERRLPATGEAIGAIPGSQTSEAQQVFAGNFAGVPIGAFDIGFFQSGKTIKIFYQAQLNNPFPQGTTQVGSQATLSGTIFFDESQTPFQQNTDDPTTPELLGDPTFVTVVNTTITSTPALSIWEPDLIIEGFGNSSTQGSTQQG